ncbi:MAG: ABC transporter permease [Planctomycetes bacterium]|nr:ABC transporter permease [Planctomycetota bacterium]
MNDLKIVTKSLSIRRFSAVTTVVTVGVAVALMLVLLTMRDAGRKAFERGSGDMHFLVSGDASPLVAVLNGVFYARPPQRALPMKKVESLRESLPIQGGRGMTPGYVIPTQQGDSFKGLPVLATTPEFFTMFKPVPGEAWQFRGGRGLEHPFEIVLGAQAAKETGLKLGDRIYLVHGMSGTQDAPMAPAAKKEDEHDHDHDHGHGDEHDHDHDHGHEGDHGHGSGAHVHREFAFTVVGILQPTGSSHDRALVTHIEASWVLHALDRREREAGGKHVETSAADLTDADRLVTGVYIRLAAAQGSNTPPSFAQVGDMLRRDTTITVASPGREIESLFRIVGNIDQIFIAMAAVVMLSSAVGIMLALYNSMNERRRQLAVLRVLGASSARVFGLVLTESAIIGILGAVMGVVLGVVGLQVTALVLKQELGLVVSSAIDPRLSVIVVGVTVILSVLAGIVPAIRAYQTSVAKHLRPVG